VWNCEEAAVFLRIHPKQSSGWRAWEAFRVSASGIAGDFGPLS
jgi:hypothetical protein